MGTKYSHPFPSKQPSLKVCVLCFVAHWPELSSHAHILLQYENETIFQQDILSLPRALLQGMREWILGEKHHSFPQWPIIK